MGLDIFITKKKRTEVGYFRKVNFLVKFFENRGLDVENQGTIEITEDEAQELLDTCGKVLEDNSKAPELLPTMSGFFFGNTDYDENYFNNVEKVRDFVKDTLLPKIKCKDSDEYFEFSIWY